MALSGGMINIIEYLLITIFTFPGVYKTLSRDRRNRLNQIFTFGYIIMVISFILFAIYANNDDPTKSVFSGYIYRSAFMLWLYIPSVLTIYFAILYKPTFMLQTKNQILFLMIYFLICLGIIFIPDGIIVEISDVGEISWPKWNIWALIYVDLLSVVSTGYAFYLYQKIQQKITIPILKQRIKWYMLGIFLLYVNHFYVPIAGYTYLPELRIAQYFVNLICLLAGILIYFAVGPKLELPKNAL